MTVSIETCKDDIREKSLLAGFFLLYGFIGRKPAARKMKFFERHVFYKKIFIGRKPTARKAKAFRAARLLQENFYRAKARSEKSEGFSSEHVIYMKGIIVI